MLPILAVLFLAQSAVAAPSIAVSAYAVNQVPVIPDNGRLVNSFIIDGASTYIDAAEAPLYANMLLETLKDMANSADISAQAEAVLTTIAVLGDLSSGIPGDSCDAAALINAYAYAASSGNNASLQQAARNYASRINQYIDLIVQLVVNPNSVKYTTGPRGTCLGGGRTYQFEEAWDNIFNGANAFTINLVNEAYCSARRLYNSFGVPSNNLAADATATAVPLVNKAAQAALPDLANFLRVVANGGNPTQAAASAKASFSQAIASA